MTVMLVTLLFRILNFGIIIGIVIYLYQRYGKKALQSMMREREEQRQVLRDEVKKLGLRVKELEKARVDQKVLGEKLAKNIDHWSVVIARNVALREEEKMHIAQALQEKTEHLKKHLAWLEIRKACVQGALQDATAELVVLYASPKGAQAYMQKVLSTMQERS